MSSRIKTTRISLVVIALLAALISPIETASAAVICQPTTVKASDPKIIPKPTANLTKFPYLMTLKTNCGDIDIELLPNAAPIAITHLSALILGGYYNETLCHRVTTSGLFIIQCGDPSASSFGLPGWFFNDENLPKNSTNNYPAGTVAMANGGPNTNGSQFFITYQDSTIPPNYPIWGRVVDGLDILQFVASKGVMGGAKTDGMPAQTLAINSVETGDLYTFNMYRKGKVLGQKNLMDIQAELDSNKSALATANQLTKTLKSKLTAICKVKPKPKGC
jgi:peptidyl-prolyl cis-trans isomerase B (cyclophilin B)